MHSSATVKSGSIVSCGPGEYVPLISADRGRGKSPERIKGHILYTREGETSEAAAIQPEVRTQTSYTGRMMEKSTANGTNPRNRSVARRPLHTIRLSLSSPPPPQFHFSPLLRTYSVRTSPTEANFAVQLKLSCEASPRALFAHKIVSESPDAALPKTHPCWTAVEHCCAWRGDHDVKASVDFPNRATGKR